jgi:hypothetical protein
LHSRRPNCRTGFTTFYWEQSSKKIIIFTKQRTLYLYSKIVNWHLYYNYNLLLTNLFIYKFIQLYNLLLIFTNLFIYEFNQFIQLLVTGVFSYLHMTSWVRRTLLNSGFLSRPSYKITWESQQYNTLTIFTKYFKIKLNWSLKPLFSHQFFVNIHSRYFFWLQKFWGEKREISLNHFHTIYDKWTIIFKSSWDTNAFQTSAGIVFIITTNNGTPPLLPPHSMLFWDPDPCTIVHESQMLTTTQYWIGVMGNWCLSKLCIFDFEISVPIHLKKIIEAHYLHITVNNHSLIMFKSSYHFCKLSRIFFGCSGGRQWGRQHYLLAPPPPPINCWRSVPGW